MTCVPSLDTGESQTLFWDNGTLNNKQQQTEKSSDPQRNLLLSRVFL